MPAVKAGLEIGGKPSSVSQPGTADANKLRAWTDRGMGTLGEESRQLQRLFRTEEEGSRPPPHVITIDDVTRGLGLESTDRETIHRLITQTRADYGVTEKLRSPRYAFAMNMLSDYLVKTKRFTSDQRMEIRRRASAWWRKYGKTTYEGRPMIRHLISKAQLQSPSLLKGDGHEPAHHEEKKPQGGGGPFMGPRGGKWADPQHTVPYTDIDKYKMRVSGQGHEETAKRLEAGINKASDICKINPPICEGNLGIERKDMPQLKDDVIPGFLKSFQDQGVSVTKGTMKVGQLKATQKEINAEKVTGMAAAKRRGEYDPGKAPIIVSKDGYVLDGHHRWAAMLHDDPGNEMRVYKVDTDIKTLLKAAQNHKGVEHGQSFESASDMSGGHEAPGQSKQPAGEAEDMKEHAAAQGNKPSDSDHGLHGEASGDMGKPKPKFGDEEKKKKEDVAQKSMRMRAQAAAIKDSYLLGR